MIQKTTLLLLLLLTITFSPQAQSNDKNTTQSDTAEDIVNKQLDAYNARDIDKFVDTYSEDIEIYDLNGKMTMKGHTQLRERYAALFKNTPDLDCRIENRIKINNKIIDKENVIMNGRKVEAVAIYEVVDGKIKKVTFVR